MFKSETKSYGQKALITGASEGLGKELAHELSKQYNFKTLKIVSRSQEKLQAVADEIGECCEV